MKPVLTALFLSVITAPIAMAGTVSFELPNLTYPDTIPSDTTQGCADLTTLGAPACAPVQN
jgi:hypothetical protein